MDCNKPLTPQDALPHMTEILARGDSFRLMVTGNSMLPFLRHQQDTVILAPVTRPIKTGDILFYLRSPQVCTLHRVHSIQSDGTLLMCGDAQVALEDIHPQQVLAYAAYIERNGRRISHRNWFWRLTVTLWRWLHPVRPHLLAVFRKLRFIR